MRGPASASRHAPSSCAPWRGGILAASRRALLAATAWTAAINALALTGPAYTLVVFDRILPGGSGAEMLIASATMLLLYALGAGADLARQRVIARCAHRIDRSLGALAARRLTTMPERELASIRAVLASQAPAALCDLPWIPLYLVALAVLHPCFCLLALAGAASVAATVLMVERLAGHGPAGGAEGMLITAGGGRRSKRGLWLLASARRREAQRAAARRSAVMGAILRALRPALQSAMLGLGGYLVMAGACRSASALAAAIVLPRVIGPVETLLAHGRSVAEAHASARRLASLLAASPAAGAAQASPSAPEPAGLRIILRSSRDYARSARRGAPRSASSDLWPMAQ